MKQFKKIIILFSFFSSLSIHAFALPLAFRAVGFVASRAFALAKNARPLAQQAKASLQKSEAFQTALQTARPHLAKVESWAVENPKEAAAGITGGLIGWETSDKGFFNTTTGVVTGAITGITLCGYSGMKAGYQVALAEAKATREAMCVIKTSHQVTLAELQAARASSAALAQEVTQLKDRYGKVSAQLAELKNAAKSAKIQKGEGSTVLESYKALWELTTLSVRKTASTSSGLPALAVV